MGRVRRRQKVLIFSREGIQLSLGIVGEKITLETVVGLSGSFTDPLENHGNDFK